MVFYKLSYCHNISVENGSSPGNNGSRPKSMAVVDNGWESHPTNLVQATYAYLSSGENQLSFHEGDTIAISGKFRYNQTSIYSLINNNKHIVGERNKGWQFGENLRTQCSGWFPLTYTEPVMEDSVFSYVYPIKTANSSMNLLYIL